MCQRTHTRSDDVSRPWEGGVAAPDKVDSQHRKIRKNRHSLVQFPNQSKTKKESARCPDAQTDGGWTIEGQRGRKEGRTINQSRLQFSDSDRSRPIRIYRRKPLPKLRIRTMWWRWMSLGRGLWGVSSITGMRLRRRAGITSVSLIIPGWSRGVRLSSRLSMIHRLS